VRHTAATTASPILDARIARADVPTVYSRLAPLYDVWAGFTEAKARRACLEAAAIRDGQDVLEVAVGTGLTFAEILRRNPHGRSTGVDVTPPMLARARQRAERTAPPGARWELARGDAYALAFPDASFDVVVNNYMFDLLPEKDFPAVVAELARVLRPGGRLVLVNMTRDARGANAFEWLYRLSPALMGGCRGVFLEPAVRAAGFGDVHRTLVVQWGVPSEVLAAVKPSEAA